MWCLYGLRLDSVAVARIIKHQNQKEKGSGNNQLAFLSPITNRDIQCSCRMRGSKVGCGVAKLDAAQLSTESCDVAM